MEDTAEQVLARLERYAASLQARPPDRPHYRSAPPFALIRASASSAAAADTMVPARTQPPGGASRLMAVAVAVGVATSSCALAVLAFMLLAPALAIVVGFALLLIALSAQVRRVPFAGAWLTGLGVAVLLIRFS